MAKVMLTGTVQIYTDQELALARRYICSLTRCTE